MVDPRLALPIALVVNLIVIVHQCRNVEVVANVSLTTTTRLFSAKCQQLLNIRNMRLFAQRRWGAMNSSQRDKYWPTSNCE